MALRRQIFFQLQLLHNHLRNLSLLQHRQPRLSLRIMWFRRTRKLQLERMKMLPFN